MWLINKYDCITQSCLPMEHYNLKKFKTPCMHIIKIYLIFGSSNKPKCEQWAHITS